MTASPTLKRLDGPPVRAGEPQVQVVAMESVGAAGVVLPQRPYITVLVPAHDEADRIAATLEGLRRQTLPPTRVVVVADNCSDETVAIARAAGAEVFETVGTATRRPARSTRPGPCGSAGWPRETAATTSAGPPRTGATASAAPPAPSAGAATGGMPRTAAPRRTAPRPHRPPRRRRRRPRARAGRRLLARRGLPLGRGAPRAVRPPARRRRRHLPRGAGGTGSVLAYTGFGSIWPALAAFAPIAVGTALLRIVPRRQG